MVLVDTTVWIDFFRGESSSQVDMLEFLISDGRDVCTCGIILTEVLQGIYDEKQYQKIKSYFAGISFLPMHQTVFIKSADMYRFLRKKGITIRKPVDCMIASTAIYYGVQLLHNDRDFDPIEEYCGLSTLKLKVGKR